MLAAFPSLSSPAFFVFLFSGMANISRPGRNSKVKPPILSSLRETRSSPQTVFSGSPPSLLRHPHHSLLQGGHSNLAHLLLSSASTSPSFSTNKRDDGSLEVQLGQTHVVGLVTAQLGQPYSDRTNECNLFIYAEFYSMTDPSYEPGRPGELAVELGRIIDHDL